MAGIDLGTLSARVKVDTSDANKSLDDFKSKTAKIGEGFNKVGTALMPLSVAISGVGIASIKASADAGEMMSKFQAVFTDLSSEAQSWADNYASAIGRSKYEIREAIANQSDLLIGMGMTNKEAMSLSTSATELAYNLASFNNVNDATAVEAMTKALYGETEMMKGLGVNLSATVMEQSEYVKQSGKAWKNMTMQEKAQAYLAEATKQSTNAVREENGVMGDAKITAQSFTNQLKAIKGNMYDLSVAIGNTLLPIIEPLVQKFNGMLIQLTKWAEENPKIVGGIVAIAGAVGLLAPAFLIISKIVTVVGSLGLTASAVVPILAGLGVSLVALAGSSQEFLNKLELGMSQALTTMANGFTKLLEKLPQIISIGLDLIGGLITGVFQGIPNFLEMLGNVMSRGLDLIIKNLPNWLSQGQKIVMSLVQGIVQRLPQWLSTMGNGIVKVLGIIAQRLPEFMSKGTEIVVRIIKGIAQNIPSIMGKMGELLGKLIAKIVEYLPQFLAKGLEIVVKLIAGLVQNLPKLLSAGKQLLDSVKQGIKNGISGLFSVGKDIVNGLLNGIKSAWSSITSWVGGAVSKLNPFKGKSITIDGEVEGGDGLPMAETINPLARGGIGSNPSLFGFGKKRIFEPSKPKTFSTDKSLVQEAKEYVINTVVELEGYQIAKASARYMQDELNALDRRATRLGGVL